MFPKAQSAFQSINDPTVGITPSPQINATTPNTSSNSQPVQNQNVGDACWSAPKDPTITVPIVQTYSALSNVQNQTLSVQNPPQYPTMRDKSGRLTG
jgi:hypothetical protein